MDPARAAMIAGHKSPDRRDAAGGPRRDRYRVSKPTSSSHGGSSGSRSQQPRPQQRGNHASAASSSRYMTEEELSKRFVDGEENFVLRQSKKKADIRVRERRAKPIDLLAFNLRWVDTDRDAFDDEEGDVHVQVPSPEAVLASTAASTPDQRQGQPSWQRREERGQEHGQGWQLDELEKDIQSFLALDKNRQNRAYWKALLVLCQDARAQKSDRGAAAAQESGRVLGSVADDIDRILQPKTLADLEKLETQIEAKLRRARNTDHDDEPIDLDYWEHLLKRLQVWKAKAALATINEAARAARLQLLRERTEAGDAGDADLNSSTWPTKKPKGGSSDGNDSQADEDETSAGKADPGGFVDDSTDPAAPPPGTARFALAAAPSNEDLSQATQALYDREVARGVGENEEIFAAEEEVVAGGGGSGGGAGKLPRWADKYRPRKPRYFNRVQMGYEWNKYNQTHYDHDNPPPKVVQGYKFNIFYPELIDKTKAPTYHITREGGRRKGESFAPAGEEDTCLIRFSAGPPYEDIAFRIVDREWDYSARRERGFKSVFEKGILQLHFQFKKIYYRK